MRDIPSSEQSVYASRCMGMHVCAAYEQLCSVCFKMCWMCCLSVCVYIYWGGLPQVRLMSCIFIYYLYNIKTLQLRGVSAASEYGILYIPNVIGRNDLLILYFPEVSHRSLQQAECSAKETRRCPNEAGSPSHMLSPPVPAALFYFLPLNTYCTSNTPTPTNL